VFHSAGLYGRDHTTLGEYEVVEVTPNLAIGISMGRFPKAYPSTDPNEDAVMAATDGEITIMAVADGHFGHDASHRVIEAIEGSLSSLANEPEAALDALLATAESAVANVSRARTALTVCVVGETGLAIGTYGDTGYRLGTKRRSPVVRGETGFLGEPDAVPARIQRDLSGLASMTVATDGLHDFFSIERLAVSRDGAASAALQLIDGAFEGGAGDNIAFALHRVVGVG